MAGGLIDDPFILFVIKIYQFYITKYLVPNLSLPGFGPFSDNEKSFFDCLANSVMRPV